MAVTLPQPACVPAPYRIAAFKRELKDTFTLALEAEQQPESFRFLPGQFNMLYCFGVGEAPISFSGDPADPVRLVHTVRAVGAVTKAMQKLRPGAVLGVRGPFGRPWPIEAAVGNDVVIVAGGLGLAPLRPAIYAMLRERPRFGRLVIFYGARSPKDILLERDLLRWRGRLDTFVDVTVDRAGTSWRGNVGVVTTLIARLRLDAENTTALVCGPEIMMRFAVRALLDQGVAATAIYLSMERNMKCAVGLCGRCQLGGRFVCRDGPVFSFDRLAAAFQVREL